LTAIFLLVSVFSLFSVVQSFDLLRCFAGHRSNINCWSTCLIQLLFVSFVFFVVQSLDLASS